FIKKEFYLGGILSGCTLINSAGWYAPWWITNKEGFELLVFTAIPLFLILGILIHWLKRMEHRVSYDSLMQIYNRTYCDSIISEQSSINTSSPLSVAMLDIDHFKKVNDTHGHKAGDDVLFHTARTITREIVPHGTVCRYGGEEIIVFFPQQHIKEAVKILERVRIAVKKSSVKSGRKTIRVTLSAGVAMREKTSQNLSQVIQTADKALYRAKKGGRNQVKAARLPTLNKKSRK
ncbi:MAG: GGDEF domain-containing protein, partial [Fibrobacteria bacterium]|nr:GGDEF domain-containing protein [Fibrobacteria bacterium]